MTKQELIQLVGPNAVDEEKDDTVYIRQVPKGHPAFDLYGIVIGPHGLVRISAFGKDIRTNGYGEDVKSAFIEIRDAVAKAYGTPETIDYLRGGSVWDEPQDWMMGLLKQERGLDAYWLSSKGIKFPNGITAIAVNAIASSTSSGYIRLVYEFEGWTAYIETKKARESTVF